MITVEVNTENQTATYSTVLEVNGRTVLLSVIKYLGYQKPYHLDHSLPLPKDVGNLFHDIFYWHKSDYTNSESTNHLYYKRMVETDYNYQSNKPYEVNWKTL